MDNSWNEILKVMLSMEDRISKLERNFSLTVDTIDNMNKLINHIYELDDVIKKNIHLLLGKKQEVEKQQSDSVVNEELPYLTETVTKEVTKYNKNYGDDRVCICGHKYYRHFDTYAEMEPVGCKHCGCDYFKEMKIS